MSRPEPVQTIEIARWRPASGTLYNKTFVENAWRGAQDLIADESNWNATLKLAEELQRHRRTCGGLMPGWRVKQILAEILPDHA
jgi:hypothetical protein